MIDREGESTEKQVNKFKNYYLQADEAEEETSILPNSLTIYLHLQTTIFKKKELNHN